MQDPTSKITKAKGARDAAQIVQHLPRKCNALSLNSSTVKTKKQPNKKTLETGGRRTSIRSVNI
jgi:hypothetical protein